MGRNIRTELIRNKRSKNKRNKLSIEFDEHKRTEYLTGFHKRKEERRKKAKDEEIQMLKEKKRQLKEKKKAEYMDHLKALKVAMDTTGLDPLTTASVVKETTRSTASHTVTVTELDLMGKVADHSADIIKDWSNAESDGEECSDKNKSDEKSRKRPLGNKSREREKREKRRKKHHINYSHSHHQRKKLTAESRHQVKKQLVKKSRRKQ